MNWGTGEPPEVEVAGNVKCFICAHWESSHIFAWMPEDVLCQQWWCLHVFENLCEHPLHLEVSQAGVPSDCEGETGPKGDGLQREPLPLPGEALWVNGDCWYLKQIQSGWLSVS